MPRGLRSTHRRRRRDGLAVVGRVERHEGGRGGAAAEPVLCADRRGAGGGGWKDLFVEALALRGARCELIRPIMLEDSMYLLRGLRVGR